MHTCEQHILDADEFLHSCEKAFRQLSGEHRLIALANCSSASADIFMPREQGNRDYDETMNTAVCGRDASSLEVVQQVNQFG